MRDKKSDKRREEEKNITPTPSLKAPFSRRAFIAKTGGATGALLVSCRTLRSSQAKQQSVLAVDLSTITRAAIHPAIGVARIGDSEEFFIGPEVVEPALTPAGTSRDERGAIKRQAARFRIYGYNNQGEIVAELTPALAEIEWQVHLANKKAEWYRFSAAQDIPEATTLAVTRRNANITGNDRANLIINGGLRSIKDVNAKGRKYHFDSGAFNGTKVYLGELQTDASGHLLVLGGKGVAKSPQNKPVFTPEEPDTFNNADGWYDDSADGPVTASVILNGKKLEVEPAWVIVGPPNFAPDVIAWRTLYDLLEDRAIEKGLLPHPTTTSFVEDVLPALQRLCNLQWVNKGFAKAFGKGGEFDFNDPKLIAKLAQKPNGDDPHAALRAGILAHFRMPLLSGAGTGSTDTDRSKWPWLYGDAFGTYDDSARINLDLSEIRAWHLSQWKVGKFDNDWSSDLKPYRTLGDVPVKLQGAMLNQAALHYCLADAFHPGCELTWPMRQTSMFKSPFRIKHRDPSKPLLSDYGPSVTFAELSQKKALDEQGPGDLTKWMALPWQGDTVFCRSGYDPQYDPYLPSFWPARVPNQVLTEIDYETTMNAALPRSQRLAAFQKRVHWHRRMRGSLPGQIEQMVREFNRMGIIEMRPGIKDDPDFPEFMLVESLPIEPAGAESFNVPPTGTSSRGIESQEERVIKEAGWESEEQLEEFKKLLKRR